MTLDVLDEKLNHVFAGKVVRKDLLLQVKKGTNVPSFVLEFLLARFCASDDPREIQEGMAAVLETIQKNYVRPDESNRAQMVVQGSGRHTFIDKIHVKYSEREKRPWARMENFNSSRIAINERFYRGENDRIFEGGIWAECTVAHNDVEDDDYAFYIEDLRPIQLSKFDFEAFVAGRAEFSRDEWLDVVIRSFGLEPGWMSPRLKFHYLARLFPLVESNYNYIELGPRGNGKSYTFSEFSPYATLLGAPTTASTLWWNAGRKQVGLIGFWDVVAFDEVGEGIIVRDRETFQIMKQYMANGNYTRANATVTANASLAFIGNIDDSVESIVRSHEHDLFKPLHPVFDLAILDRFHTFVPGWEIPKNKDESLTRHYGLIIEYLAETFHHVARRTNRFTFAKSTCKLGRGYDQRDQTAVLKTVCAFLKILHPGSDPSPQEMDEYLAYAVEGRRRVKEQLNKRKPDDEFAHINLSFVDSRGEEIVVYCPESRHAEATQDPRRDPAPGNETDPAGTPLRLVRAGSTPLTATPAAAGGEGNAQCVPLAAPLAGGHAGSSAGAAGSGQGVMTPSRETPLKERHYRIHFGATGFSYATIFGDYLSGADEILVEDPYIRAHHQVVNFLRFCETAVRLAKPKRIVLTTTFDNPAERDEALAKLQTVTESLKQFDVTLDVRDNPRLHDRQVRLSNGWVVKIGRGLDIYQRPDDWLEIGANDLDLRPCLETTVDVFLEASAVRS
ncbi:MAG: BREX system Lon protease-like protein BrxL [Verrucomicrobiales bacterium]|nr:BREX system Lon protease-like protein BrxL [Verrucomicrobiales bacterium]